MRRIVLLITLLFVIDMVMGQVGINTVSPQQLVHVAGNVENVRIDGLNETNNSDNLGANSSSKVYVDANGDLKLGTGFADENIDILVDSANYLKDVENPTSIVIQTGVNFGYSPAGLPADGIPGASFTLTSNAILEVNYSISWSIYDAISRDKKRLDDRRARVIQTGIYFIDTATEVAIVDDVDGNPINGGGWCIDPAASGVTCKPDGYAGLIGLTAQFYNNYHQEKGSYRDFRNNASDYVRLGPGTYTALFAARLQVEVITGGGAAKMWLGADNDELQILAYYYD